MFAMSHLCGICRKQKKSTTYTFQQKLGVVTKVVWLCGHCDLTGEGPR